MPLDEPPVQPSGRDAPRRRSGGATDQDGGAADLPGLGELAFDDELWEEKEERFALVRLFEFVKNDRAVSAPE
jgi:hypothetical protein